MPPRIASASERYLLQDHILWKSHMHRLLRHMYKILAILAKIRTIVTSHLAPKLPVELAEAANFSLCPHLLFFPIFTEVGLMFCYSLTNILNMKHCLREPNLQPCFAKDFFFNTSFSNKYIIIKKKFFTTKRIISS